MTQLPLLTHCHTAARIRVLARLGPLDVRFRREPYSARVLRRGLGISSGELLALLRELGARRVDRDGRVLWAL